MNFTVINDASIKKAVLSDCSNIPKWGVKKSVSNTEKKNEQLKGARND